MLKTELEGFHLLETLNERFPLNERGKLSHATWTQAMACLNLIMATNL